MINLIIIISTRLLYSPLIKIILIIFVLNTDSFYVFANEHNLYTQNKSFQLQAIAYSSLGTGISFGYRFDKNVGLNFDIQSLNGTMSTDSNEALTKEDAYYSFQTRHVNVRKYLTDIVNNFFIQYGIVSKNWDTKTIIKSNGNDQRKAVYKTKYSTYGINIGVGMNWVFDNGLSSGLYLIKIITKEPSFAYELSEGWECNSSCQSNYESNVKKYTPNDSVNLSFGYNF